MPTVSISISAPEATVSRLTSSKQNLSDSGTTAANFAYLKLNLVDALQPMLL